MPPSPPPSPRLLPALGLLLLALALTFLEWRQPFYFTQDDTLSQFVPVLTAVLEGWWATGMLPTWNAYNGLGMPLSSGGYSITYPPLYAAYALARLLGNPLYLMEIFAFAHLMGGYWLMQMALRGHGVRPFIAVCAALSFVLTGYMLVQGRGWHSVLTLAFYLPALLWSLLFAMRCPQPGLRWIVCTGLSIALLFHAGHTQFWIYACLMWGIGIAWVAAIGGPRNPHPALAGISAALLGLGLSVPLLWVQYIEQLAVGYTQSGLEDGLQRGWKYFFYPPLEKNISWRRHFFSTGIFSVLGVAYVFLLLHALRRKRQRLQEAALPVTLVLVFLYALGSTGYLWSYLAAFEPFSKFRWLHKLIPFQALLLVACGALGAEMLARKAKLRRGVLVLIGLCTISGLSWTVIHAKGSPFSYAARPYPPLPQAMRAMDMNPAGPGLRRLLSTAPDRSFRTDYVGKLPLNFASYYRLFSANRYNQRITASRATRWADRLSWQRPQTFLKVYGIGWFLQTRMTPGDRRVFKSDYHYPPLRHAVNRATSPGNIFPYGTSRLYALKELRPDALVFLTDAPERGLPFHILPGGLHIRLPEQAHFPSPLVVNFLWHAWFKAYDAETGMTIPVRRDPFWRMLLTVPDGVRQIQLVYSPPWARQLPLTLALLLGSLAAAWPAIRRRRLFLPHRGGGAA